MKCKDELFIQENLYELNKLDEVSESDVSSVAHSQSFSKDRKNY